MLFCRTRWFGPLLNFLTDSALFTLRKDEAVCKTYSRGLEETHGAWHMTTAACVREAGVKTFACATTSTPAPRSTASKSADGFLILHPSPVSFGRGRVGAAAHQIGQESEKRCIPPLPIQDEFRTAQTATTKSKSSKLINSDRTPF